MSARAATDDEQGLRANHAARSGTHSWVVSFFFHAVVLLMLAMFALPGFSRQRIQMLEGSMASADSAQFAMAAVTLGDPSSTESEPQEVVSPVTVPTTRATVPTVTVKEMNRQTVVDPVSVKLLTAKSSQPFGAPDQPVQRKVSGSEAIRRADGIGEAISGLGDSLSGELLQGDTLIVWLLDASPSVEENRLAMVRHTRELYRSINSFAGQPGVAGSGHELLSSVVVFGQDATELVPPTKNCALAVDAISNVPSDPSGIENVMAAVRFTVDSYRTQFQQQRMLVALLTDESGDDTADLESTIGLCRDAGMAIHVIGPTSAMGCGLGSQHCTVKERSVNYSFWLNVHRGPETSMPERCFLPYWHQSPLPPWKQQGAWAVQNADWYGGTYRERVLSGFGPYELTRLALQTGGTYMMYDADRRGRHDGVYDLEALREYAPEYGTSAQYQQALQGNPLRQLVVDTAAVSLADQDAFLPPRFSFFAERSRFYPYNIQSIYRSPAEFRSQLPQALEDERARVQVSTRKLADLVDRLQDPSVDWQRAFANEKSKRWRASFALTKGRLLASQARYIEYLAATVSIASQLKRDTNEVSLRPDDTLRDPASVALVAEAKRCLEACVAENAGTPWEDLARWELEKPFGLRIEQSTVRPSEYSVIATPTRTPTTFAFPKL